jgi:hypothetical protein
MCDSAWKRAQEELAKAMTEHIRFHCYPDIKKLQYASAAGESSLIMGHVGGADTHIVTQSADVRQANPAYRGFRKSFRDRRRLSFL